MRVLIMGGTSGIGLAAAQLLTEQGAEVTVTGRDLGKLDAVRESVAGAEQLDGTDREAVAAFMRRFGAFEHLVLALSPGAVGIGPVKEVAFSDLKTAMGKLFAYLDAIREAQVTDSITMISAASGHAAYPDTVALSAANGAIERIVAPLATELAPVRVNAVSPGIVDTPWWSFLSEDEKQRQFAGFAEQLKVARVATGHDVAEAVAYLINATVVTGSIMPVDGGLTMA
jgi:NAD(P)-dependent dehydrogenase (short-subunit alcohol dehydrogenase family)